ncbi:MAG: hypothetical protein U1F71_23540 [Verrucomicrobiaceae bacterium]
MKTIITLKQRQVIALILAYAISYGIFRFCGTCVYRICWNNHVDSVRMIQDTDVAYRGVEFSKKLPVYRALDFFYWPMKKLELFIRPTPEPLPLYEGYTRGHFARSYSASQPPSLPGSDPRPGEGTRFAPGYSDKAFYSIKLGDDEAAVTKLLGAPLSSWTNDTQILGLTHIGQAIGGNPAQKFPNGPRTHWAYASGPMPAFSSQGRLEDEVDYTVFAFDGSGRVEEVFGQVVSAKQVGVLSAGATVTAGDGLNFLKLSNAQIAMLK